MDKRYAEIFWKTDEVTRIWPHVHPANVEELQRLSGMEVFDFAWKLYSRAADVGRPGVPFPYSLPEIALQVYMESKHHKHWCPVHQQWEAEYDA